MTTTTESQPARPDVLPPQIDSIPPELRQLRQWMCWRLALRQDGKGEWRWTKEPLSARTGELGSSTDPAAWSSLGEALSAFRDGLGDGVGFVFSADGPHSGVDLDHCRDPETGVIEPLAQSIIDRLDSFTEGSPSATSVHVIARGELPPGRRRKGQIEMYDQGRYFTMAGHVIAGSTIEERSSDIAAIHAETFPQPAGKPTNGATPHVVGTDFELIEKAAGASNGVKFGALFGGSIAGYESQSEADLALCGMLGFYTGPDPAQLDRLFRQSGLYRDKWDERHGPGTYGEITIGKALDGRAEFYDWSQANRDHPLRRNEV